MKIEYGIMSNKWSVEADDKLVCYATILIHIGSNGYNMVVLYNEECKQDQWAHYEEPVSEDLEEYSASVADELPQGTALTSNGEFDIASVRKLIIDACKFGAKWGKNQAMAEIQAQSMALAHGCPEESKNEDLEEAAWEWGLDNQMGMCTQSMKVATFKAGAKWKEQQLMSKAIDVTVHIEAGNYPYIPQMELYDYDKDIPLAKEGDKYKVVLIKED